MTPLTSARRTGQPETPPLGGTQATRRNERRLIAGKTGWVRNGDRWTITALHDDSSATVRRAGHRRGATVVRPAAYAAEELTLGYALTAHRAQGATVDSSHAVITARDVLTHALTTSDAEPSAHQAQRDEHEGWESLPQLVVESQQIAAAARRDYNALPNTEKAALLKQRLDAPPKPRLIAGLIPEPTIPMADDLRHALDVRRIDIEQRVTNIVRQTLADQPEWLAELGPRPARSRTLEPRPPRRRRLP